MDTVSGATFSSNGLITAVRNALAKAAGEKNDAAADSGKNDPEKTLFDYADGIYVGTGEGYNDDIILGLTIRDKTLAAITVLYQDDTPEFFGMAQEIIRTIVNTQNTEADAVSGATFSSRGILEAVKNALDNAEKGIGILDMYGEKTDPDDSSLSGSVSDNDPDGSSQPGSVSDNDPAESPGTSAGDSEGSDPGDESGDSSISEPDTNMYINGTYTGTALCTADEDEDFEDYNLTLTIEIRDDAVTAVTDISGDGGPDNDSYINRAANGTKKLPGTVAQILSKGSADGVDTVSGATCSSKAIIAAVRNALEKAGK